MAQAPERVNPFPRVALVTDSIAGLPNLETNFYVDARRKLREYQENFFLSQGTRGTALGIRGRFGTGKTHLCFQLASYIGSSTGVHAKTLYAKADSADPLALYRNHLAGRIQADDLKTLVSLHLAKLLRLRAETAPPPDGTEQETLPQIARKEVEKYLAANPQFILDLVQRDLLPLTDLHRELDEKLEQAARDDQREPALRNPDLDFFCAYSKIAYPALEKLAVRWIQGDKLSSSEAKDLGLTSPGIQDADQAKRALRFLLEAYRRAEIAFLFCLDEFERFALRGTPEDRAASPGLLKDLAEVFKDTGQILIVSGVDDAWANLPKDVFDRIKRDDIIETRLLPDEARQLLGVYLSGASLVPESGFERAALNLICEVGGDNARRLLSVAHHAFRIAGNSDAPISEAVVQQAAVTALSDAQRKQDAARRIEEVASRMRLAIARDIPVGDVNYDFVLGDPVNPSVMVSVTQSIFKLDELTMGRSIAGSTRVVSQANPQARTCTVIVGYSTAEVRDALAKVVDRVLVYDEDHFVPEFEEFLQSSLLPIHQVEQRITSQAAAYNDLLSRFERLEQERQAELDQLKKRVESLQSERLAREQTVREKRTSEKLVDALDELGRLLRSEELASLRAWKQSWGTTVLDRQAFEEALRLIDDHRIQIRRARILVEGLTGAEKFSALLDRLVLLADQTEDSWRQAYKSVSEKSPASSSFQQHWSQLYAERRRALTDLEELRVFYDARRTVRFLGMKMSRPVRSILLGWIAVSLGLVAVALWYLNPSVKRELKSNPNAVVTGLVEDESGAAVPDALVSVLGGEAGVTSANGSFTLRTNAPVGQQVRLHAAKAGYKPVDEDHPAGPVPVRIVLVKYATKRAK